MSDPGAPPPDPSATTDRPPARRTASRRPHGGRRTVGILLWILAVATLAAIVLIALFVPRPAEPEIDAPIRSEAVRTLPATDRGVSDYLELPGRIEPVMSAVLAAEKPGRIVGLSADRGDRVSAGQVLVRLDGEAWAARLRLAEIELREAIRDLNRTKDLMKSGALPQSAMDAAQARMDLAEASLADARVQVRQCDVIAPANGVVVDRMVEVGEHAMEGQPVMRIVDIETVKAVFDLPERAVGDLAPGGRVRISVDGLGGATSTAEVSFVSADADPRSNTYRVEARMPNPDLRLRGGMIVRVGVEREAPPGLVAVPLAAVIPRRGEHSVYIAVDGHAEHRTVTLDRIVGEMAVLSAGVAAGEPVIIEGHRNLADGANITVLDDGPAAGDGP